MRPRAVPRTVPQLDLENLTTGDASIGTSLPSNTITQKIKALSDKTVPAHLFVFIGACSECISNRIEDWQAEAQKRKIGYLMVSTSPQSDIAKFASKHKITVPVISDEQQILFHHLNARWAGRPYLFSKDWNLLWQEQKMHIDFALFSNKDFLAAIQKEAQRP